MELQPLPPPARWECDGALIVGFSFFGDVQKGTQARHAQARVNQSAVEQAPIYHNRIDWGGPLVVRTELYPTTTPFFFKLDFS